MATSRVLIGNRTVIRRNKNGGFFRKIYDPNDPRDVAIQSEIDDIWCLMMEQVTRAEMEEQRQLDAASEDLLLGSLEWE
jgi:hypothetical protein